MTKPRYYSLNELIKLIEEPNRTSCVSFLEKESEILRDAKGSTHNHQSWKGGYLDHITDAMNLAVLFYDALSSTTRPLNFSLSDSLLVLFLHDLEKPFKQLRGAELELITSDGRKNISAIKSFRESLFEKYGFKLTPRQRSAVRYAEGENEDYSSEKRTMDELAAFCHLCDSWSARGWHDYPKNEGDKWKNNTN